jgi:hypothetical protein
MVVLCPLPPAGRRVPRHAALVVRLGDPQRDIGEAVDEIAQRLDLGVREKAVLAEDLAAPSYAEHSTHVALVNSC